MSKLPLYRHKNGQWCKRIGGKIYYFGTDLPNAIKLYGKSRDSIAAGCGKVVDRPDLPLHRLADTYYDHKQRQLLLGELTSRSLSDIKNTLSKLCAIAGRESDPAMWDRHSFASIRDALFKPIKRKEKTGGRPTPESRSHITVGGDIRRIKAFLNWCYKNNYLPEIKHGGELSQPKARIVRLEKQKSTSGPLAAKDIKAIIAQCNKHFLPVVMLGINGGMGAADIAQLSMSQMTQFPWLNCPRQKTGAPRRIWLWPETQKAINDCMQGRKEPRECYSHIALLTSHQTPWVREGIDAATQMFTKAREAAGLSRGSFYDLRRTFQTVGDETLDFPAVSFCMGHAPNSSDMAARYRQVGDERIQAVCERVRQWLFD